MKRYHRRISNMNSTVEHETTGHKVIRLLNALGKLDTREKELLVTHAVNDRFREASEYRTYRLSDKWSCYGDEVL